MERVVLSQDENKVTTLIYSYTIRDKIRTNLNSTRIHSDSEK